MPVSEFVMITKRRSGFWSNTSTMRWNWSISPRFLGSSSDWLGVTDGGYSRASDSTSSSTDGGGGGLMRLGRTDKDDRGSVLYGSVSGADRPLRRSGWGLRDRDVLLKEPVVRKFWKLSLSSIMAGVGGVLTFVRTADCQRARGSSGHGAVTARQ